MTIGVAAPNPILAFTFNNGQLASGGSILTQVGGVNTATYADSALIVPLPNPIPLNSRGEISNAAGASSQLFLTANTAYIFTLFDGPNGTGNQIWQATYVNGVQVSLTQGVIGLALYPQTTAENAVGVTPVNFNYPPGHIYRYGTNTTPGTTDMTTIINTAANVCRQGNYTLQLPTDAKQLVTASLNFSSCHVIGLGNAFNSPGGIQASSAQFDVITSTGFTILENVWVDGGWDGVTAGQTGDILSLKAVSPAHPYLNSFRNCNFQNAKKRGIYIERGGYTDLYHMHVLGCGLHALECFGINTDACTSITDSGGSQYGSTPYGYGIKLTECTQMGFTATICEATCGLQFNGPDNRLWSFDRIYQEFQPTPSFTAKIDNGSGLAGTTLTVTAPATLAGLGVGSQLTGAGIAANTFITATGTGTGGIGTYTVNNSQLVASEAMTASILFVVDNSGGVGLIFRGCFGIGATMPFSPSTAAFQNWTGVYFQGNNGMSDGPIPLAGRIQTNGNGTNTVTVTSDVTAGQLTLSPGTYRLWGAVQTIISSGAGTLTQLACQITTNVAAVGLNNALPITEAAAQTSSIGANQDARVNCFTEVQVFAGAAVTYYLRARIALSGVITEAYSGLLRAELIE